MGICLAYLTSHVFKSVFIQSNIVPTMESCL